MFTLEEQEIILSMAKHIEKELRPNCKQGEKEKALLISIINKIEANKN
jgi:hypothetical protein